MNRSEQINELAAALAKAQGAIEGAKKDSVNPHFKSAYADLASVWDAIRKPLTDNGLSLSQWLRTTEAGVTVSVTSVEVETMLMHTSGQWMSDVLSMPCQQMTAHAVGSLGTYLRRYSAMAICGVAPIDDDGNAATEAHKPGVPGMASGGTAFRPATRRMPTSNWVDDAMNDGIVDQSRSKGALPPKPANANGNGNAIKRAEWVKKAIAVFQAAQSKDELTQWWKDAAERIEIIENAMPAEYERLIAAYDAAVERTARS